jgi:competence transcription factor ComK
MIEYMMHHPEGLLVYQTDQILQLPMTSKRYIKTLCEQALFSYEGYLKACQKQTGISYRIPVVIDFETMLIPSGGIRVYETIWINFPAISQMHETDQGVMLTFISGRRLRLEISRMQWMKQIEVLMEIRNTKVKHFHGHSSRKCLQ